MMGQKNSGKTQILHKLCVILLIELRLDGENLPKILHKSYRNLQDYKRYPLSSY